LGRKKPSNQKRIRLSLERRSEAIEKKKIGKKSVAIRKEEDQAMRRRSEAIEISEDREKGA
jgi:hypothetical protein